MVTNLGASPDFFSTYVLGVLGLAIFALCIIMIIYAISPIRYRMGVNGAASGFLFIIWMLALGLSCYCVSISEQGFVSGNNAALVLALKFLVFMISMSLVIYKFLKMEQVHRFLNDYRKKFGSSLPR